MKRPRHIERDGYDVLDWRDDPGFFITNLWQQFPELVIGMVFGFIIGFIMGAMGFPPRVIAFVTAPIEFVIGLAISVLPMKMILGKDFGEFRLVLLARDEVDGITRVTIEPPLIVRRIRQNQ